MGSLSVNILERNKLLQKLKIFIYRHYITVQEKIYLLHSRLTLKNKSFTIISNNCWAGSVYQDLNLPFNTPVIGLFFYGPCYIKLLEDLSFYMSQSLLFTEISKYDVANQERERRKLRYPIGVLHDVEIHFLHYKSNEEANTKWTKRKKRINYNNLFVVFSDVDIIDADLVCKFDKLPYKNKVFFSASENNNIKSLIWLKQYSGMKQIGDITIHKKVYRKYFNVVRWLNYSNIAITRTNS